MIVTLSLICVIALSLLGITLLGIIIRLEHELAQARQDALVERMVAEIFQELAQAQEDMAHVWLERATARDAVDGIPAAFLEAWSEQNE